MAGNKKFDQEAVLKVILDLAKVAEKSEADKLVVNEKRKKLVQRSYFLELDLYKKLKYIALVKDIKMTKLVNDIIRKGIEDYSC